MFVKTQKLSHTGLSKGKLVSCNSRGLDPNIQLSLERLALELEYSLQTSKLLSLPRCCSISFSRSLIIQHSSPNLLPWQLASKRVTAGTQASYYYWSKKVADSRGGKSSMHVQSRKRPWGFYSSPMLPKTLVGVIQRLHPSVLPKDGNI